MSSRKATRWRALSVWLAAAAVTLAVLPAVGNAQGMRLEPGERERLRGELREQHWRRSVGPPRWVAPGPGYPAAPYPAAPPPGYAAPGYGGPAYGGPAYGGPVVIAPVPFPGPPGGHRFEGPRLSPDERRELRQQLRNGGGFH